MPTEPNDVEQRRVVRAWCLYDWANSAFATVILGAVFPIFYMDLVTSTGLSANTATSYWGYTTALAMLLVAIIGPVLGTISDIRGGKKRFLLMFASMGSLASMLFVVIGSGNFMLASGLFIIGNIGFAGSIIFYDSLLPSITNEKNLDRVSALGYAIGYIGGGLLLAASGACIHFHEWFTVPAAWFGISTTLFAVKASFVSVGVWWLVFMIPIMRRVPEPKMTAPPSLEGNVLVHGFRRLKATLLHIRQYKQLMLFLLAFWLYSDGIGTIIKLAAIYGKEQSD